MIKHGINKHGVNYYVISDHEFYCTYYDSTNIIEITITGVTLDYIQKLTIIELIEHKNKSNI
jgi:hypothetical protein